MQYSTVSPERPEGPEPRGATAVLGGRRSLRPSPYLVFGTLFWVVLTAAAWRLPICCDFGQHAAVVERLKADLLNPAHPMADLPGDGSAYYTPYTVVQALFAKATGLAGWQVVKLSGAVNLLVLLTGIGQFVKTLSTRAWAPVFALVFMVVLWGTQDAWWSGYLGLMSMTGHLNYPSTFAIGVAFWIWALTGRLARDGGGPWAHTGLGALWALVLLTHPITAVAAMIGVVALVLGLQRDLRPLSPVRRALVRWELVRWALSGAIAVLLAASWPYFSVFSLVGDSSIDSLHRQLYFGMAERYWLALVALPALWMRFRRSRRDPLVLMFVMECVVVAYGWFSGHYTYGRILGLTLVPAQFALAIELARPWPWPRAHRVLAPIAAGAACLGFFSAQAGAVVPRSLDPVGFEQPPRWHEYGWAARHIGPGEVVLTGNYRHLRSIAGYGPNVVAPIWPDASLDERERQRRARDVEAYLAPTSTRAERDAIVRRYHVRWLLLDRSQRVPEEAVVVAWGPRSGDVLARVGMPD
ncbi:hypothetical protein [Streptomyces apocyni]|uniref:hypothetical protein n=1 Tax=Streptomyces apocyni TaxID=2654677 RepID=UPI001E4BD811|nr:hypothetical protein [Streptomyces apocyni]